jgi:hypothetical protein
VKFSREAPARQASVVAMLACASLGTGFAEQPSVFDRPLPTPDLVIFVPAGADHTPSDAGEMGLLSRLARLTNVPFGFESDSEAPRATPAASVEPRTITATTLRAALDAFVAMDSRYRWKDVSGAFVVRTTAAWDDPRDALNQRAHDVHWRELRVLSAFDHLAHLLYPQDPRVYFEGIRDAGNRSFDVDVVDGTILEVLDATVRADGELGWWVAYGTASDRQQFALTLGHYGNGPTASWRERPPIARP